MANTIASLAVQLSLKANNVTAGLQKVGENLHGLGGMATTAASAMTKAFMGVPPLSEMLGGIGGMSGTWESLHKTMEEIDSIAKVADRLGISTEHLTGLQHAADLSGVKAEALTSGLEILSRKLGQIAQQGEGASESLSALSIDLDGMGAVAGSISKQWEALGLDAQKIAKLPLADALQEVAERMTKLETAADRNALAFAVFGRRGQALMPMLLSGRKGIQEMIEEANRLGYSFSRLDAAKVEAANDAMSRIGHVLEGIKRNAAIELAPIIAVVAENFTKWLDSIGGVKGGIKQIGEFTTNFLANTLAIVGKITEVLEKAEKLMDRLEGGGNFLGGAFKSSTGPLADILELLGSDRNAIAATGEGPLSGRIRDLVNDLRNIQQRFSSLETPGGNESIGNSKVAQDAQKRAEDLQKKIGDMKATLDATTSAYGRNSNQVQVNKLMLEGATAAQLAAVQAKVSELEILDQVTGKAAVLLNIYEEWAHKAEQLEAAFRTGKISADGLAGAMQKIGDALLNSEAGKAASLFQETRTPLELMQSKLDELNMLLDRGAISWEVYERAVNGATKAVMDLHKAESLRMSGSQEFGSQEAYATINRTLLNSGGKQSGIETLKDAIKEQLKVQEKQKKDLDEIAKAARKGFLAVGRI